jgi:phosphoribosylformylglycinamidine (FGAM) synthase-like enzyme
MPIVSGNVSLYNETDGQAILPTPDHRRGGADRAPTR